MNAALGSELFSADVVSVQSWWWAYQLGCVRPRAARGGCTRQLRCTGAAPEPSLPPSCLASQVARALLRGVERGAYHLPSPDLGQNMLVAGMTSLR